MYVYRNKLGCFAAGFRFGRFREAQDAAGKRRRVAGYAEVAGGVRSVGRNAYVQHGVPVRHAAGRQVFRKRLPDAGRCPVRARQRHDFVVLVRQAQFVFRANHAFGGFAAQFRFADDDGRAPVGVFAVGQGERGPWRGDRHVLSGGHIRGAAHDAGGFRAAQVHFATGKPVGVRMGAYALHPPHDHPVQRRPDFPDVFHLQPAHGEDFGQFLRAFLDGGVFP